MKPRFFSPTRQIKRNFNMSSSESTQPGGAEKEKETAPEKPQPDHDAAEEKKEESGGDDAAAKVIQRNYRGYRARREAGGCGMSAESRWHEALKDAQFKNLTKARPKVDGGNQGPGGGPSAWGRLAGIASRAGGDEDDPTAEEESKSRTEEYYRMRLKAKAGGSEGYSKTMGLEYWLEMIDNKHRYGANLSAYHKVWHDTDTNENFFHWLDEGEGKNIDTEKCSREKLDKQQLHYLSREERQEYLLDLDDQGRFRWAKNGERVTTNIRPKDEDGENTQDKDMDGTSGQVESLDHMIDDLHNARGIIEASGASAPHPLAWLVNTKYPKSTKSEWIFVMDTSFRVYAGRKESGVFQHSSFLHGSRVLSSGLISIEDGLLRSVSPHSGHYRPSPQNFWALVKCLEAEGVDMSGASVYQSYAILLAAQTYSQTASSVLSGIDALSHQKDKIFNPQEAARREEAEQDKSQSAALEREKSASESIVGQMKEVLTYPFQNK